MSCPNPDVRMDIKEGIDFDDDDDVVYLPPEVGPGQVPPLVKTNKMKLGMNMKVEMMKEETETEEVEDMSEVIKGPERGEEREEDQERREKALQTIQEEIIERVQEEEGGFEYDDDKKASFGLVCLDDDPDVLYLPLSESDQNGLGIRERSKRFFMCDICDVFLSSDETLRSHVRGSKHEMVNGLHYFKGKIFYRPFPFQASSECEALALSGDLHQRLLVRQIKRPFESRKKVPVRLQIKLLERKDPVIGLEVVQEFRPASNEEMEPKYQCSLCACQGDANGTV